MLLLKKDWCQTIKICDIFMFYVFHKTYQYNVIVNSKTKSTIIIIIFKVVEVDLVFGCFN